VGRIGRHDNISKIIYLQCKDALLHPIIEPRSDNNSQQRADIEIPNWTDGKSALLDIGITNPTCQSNVIQSAATPGHAIMKYELMKMNKYANICETEGKVCVPIISETFGKWSETSITTLKRIMKMLAIRNDKPVGLTFLRLIQRLALSVQKSNVQMIACRVRPANNTLL
jgi:hypothetical protein